MRDFIKQINPLRHPIRFAALVVTLIRVIPMTRSLAAWIIEGATQQFGPFRLHPVYAELKNGSTKWRGRVRMVIIGSLDTPLRIEGKAQPDEVVFELGCVHAGDILKKTATPQDVLAAVRDRRRIKEQAIASWSKPFEPPFSSGMEPHKRERMIEYANARFRELKTRAEAEIRIIDDALRTFEAEYNVQP